MKSTRTLLLTLAIMLFGAGLFAQSAEKVLVRSFNPQGAELIALDLAGPIKVDKWTQNTVRIQMTVSLERGTDSMLRSLLLAGRYNLKGQLEQGDYLISVPGLAREVLVNGVPLNERISYQVFVPEEADIDILSTASAGL
jgi:hypothetical protein